MRRAHLVSHNTKIFHIPIQTIGNGFHFAVPLRNQILIRTRNTTAEY